MSEQLTGGCLCGAIRYVAHNKPSGVPICHCTMCRRATGQPRVTGAYFELNQVTFTKGKPKRYRSSPYAERGFCGDCGTPLFYHALMPELQNFICMMVGTLDHPEHCPPTGHWNIETALPYALTDDGLPRHRQIDSPYEWVRDSIEKS